MDGIIPLWKEQGMTSHDCVFKVRKILKMKKVGHGGTLDPSVNGILPICIGKGTKLLDYLQAEHKTYFGEVLLGVSTTTEDSDGEVIEKADALAITSEQVDAVMQTMQGVITQVPPMYSAVKVNGRKLYEYAREGLTVERPQREVEIYQFKRTSDLEYNNEQKTVKFSFLVECSKGTYVRTLAVDLGAKLGLPAHMSRLTRMSSGGFNVSQGITLAKLKELVEQDELDKAVYPLETILKKLPRYDLRQEEYRKVKNGVPLYLQRSEDKLALWYQEQVVAIYENKNNSFVPEKMLRLTIGD